MTEMILSHDMLNGLAARSSYEVPDDEIVLFGVRGLLPLNLSGTDFTAEHRVRLTVHDHQHMRCTIGQWRPASGDLALFPGSTVPNLSGIAQAKVKNGIGANMLMLGAYAYDRGVHKAGKPTGHRAFRQGMFFPVWRTTDDLDFDLEDRLDLAGIDPDNYPWDNLHCAYADNVDLPRFSSNGCQVVAGHPTMPANNNAPESGPWKRFIANAYGHTAKGQKRFVYFLFSGAEIGRFTATPDGPLDRYIRFGSKGRWVELVQQALQGKGFPFLPVDGGFGRDTLEALMRFQLSHFGPGTADGVVGPNTASALGIGWPAHELGTLKMPSKVAGMAKARSLAARPDEIAVPATWKAAAILITPGFETKGDPYVAVEGDFDGMGISCGALQWNIGQGSFQPMVAALGQKAVGAAMPSLGAELWSACNSKIPEGLAIVRRWQSGIKLKPVARLELEGLMGLPAMRVQQDIRITAIAETAFALATSWAEGAGRAAASKREFVWFFDLVTQNGGLKGLTPTTVAQFIKDAGKGGAEQIVCAFLAKLRGKSGHIKDANINATLWTKAPGTIARELLVASYLRSGTASAEWRHIVLNRKGTIAMGIGRVNSTDYDFSSHLD